MARALSWRYWRQHSLRAALVLACLTLGVSAWSATQALDQGVRNAGRSVTSPLAGAADLFISNDDAGVSLSWLEPIRRVSGVREVRPILIRRGRILNPRPINVTVLGIDPAEMKSSFAGQFRLSPGAIANLAAARFSGRPTALLGRRLANQIGASSGDLDLQLDGKRRQLGLAGTIEGINEFGSIADENVLVMDLGEVSRLIGDPERVSRLDVVLSPDATSDVVRRHLESIVAGRGRIRSARSLNERADEMLGGLTTAFSLCGLGALIAGLLLIHNVYAVSVAERRQISGVLRALGATRIQLLVAMTAEAILFGFSGGLFALPAAYLMARVAAGPIQNVLSEIFLPMSGTEPSLTTGVCISGILVGIGASFLAALSPAMQSAGVDPKESLRRIGSVPRHGLRWQWIWLIAVLAAIGGLLQTPIRPSSWGPWPSLVCVVVAGLVAAPQLTWLLAWSLRRLARRWIGVGATFALDNLLRCPRRYGLATAVLAGGTALLVQTGGVIRGNEEALRDWLDRSVIGDLFVTSGGLLSASGQNQPMSDDLAAAWRRQIPGLHVVPMRFRHVDWQQGDHSARLLLVLLDAAAYRATIDARFPDLPDRALYQQLSEQPGTALVSRNFAALHGFSAGDSVILPSANGPKSFRILGAVADYSCTQGSILLDRGRCAGDFAAGMADVYSVTAPPGRSVDEVRQVCRQTPEESLSVLTHAEMRSHTLGLIDRLYGVAMAEQGIVAIVAILGVAAAMLISVLQRSAELGLLRALGATRTQITRVVLAEAFLIGVLGTFTGLLLGIPLEWFTVKVVLFAETGFVFPVRFPWREATIVACTAPVGAALAGVVPALSAARRNLAGACAGE